MHPVQGIHRRFKCLKTLAPFPPPTPKAQMGTQATLRLALPGKQTKPWFPPALAAWLDLVEAEEKPRKAFG